MGRSGGWLAGASLVLAMPAAAQTVLDRAVYNYRALASGAKQLSDLSPAERADVDALQRLLADRPALGSRDCERQRAAATTNLDRAVLDLKCPQGTR